MAYHNLRSKLDRAIAAYLVSVGAGTIEDTVPANWSGVKEYPITEIRTLDGNPEDKFVGNYQARVTITIKGSVAEFIDDVGKAAARVAHDARVSQVYDALMQTNDGRQTFRATAALINAAGRALATSIDASIAANNADMADFTVDQWADGGWGQSDADAEGCDWVEILNFDCVVRPSNTD